MFRGDPLMPHILLPMMLASGSDYHRGLTVQAMCQTFEGTKSLLLFGLTPLKQFFSKGPQLYPAVDLALPLPAETRLVAIVS